MSQRLYIGVTEDKSYDCVLSTEEGAEEKIKSEFLFLRGDFYLGPWKIRIKDKELYRKLEPILIKVFKSLREPYPSCIWTFYAGAKSIEHPYQEELDRWLQE